MDTFEDLGLPVELVEALASEGIELPTPLQAAAIPVLRRDNNLLLAAGPGSGTLVTWGAVVLERLDPEAVGIACLALTPTADAAQGLAESLQRLASTTGHTVAALGSPWALPERAHVLFGTPAHVRAAAAAGRVDLGAVATFVVDQADRIEHLDGLGMVEEILGFLPKESQRIVTSLPVTAAVQDLVERHARRAASIPALPADGKPENAPVARGALQYRIVQEPKEPELLATVASLLADDARHVLVFTRSEDRAADVGDYLTLRGYAAGAPGDPSVPVWLGVQELEARGAAEGAEGVVVLSHDVPADPDSMDRRHGLDHGGVVLVLPREVSHLRDVARRTGYTVAPLPSPNPENDEAQRFRDMLARAIEEEDAAPYLLLLEPLFERFDAAEVAAAAAALLRKKGHGAPPAPPAATSADRQSAPVAWVKVFLSVGERDGLSAKDLVGAITGEANVAGSNVGKIDIRESHTVLEVMEPVARKVITALNGTTIRGRAVRADFDRPKTRTPTGRSPGGPRGGPPRGKPPRRS
jgi:ATP-dependent RNA helicase DeaD